MDIRMQIEFPALDRLCAWLEGCDKAGLVRQLEEEIVGKLKAAAESGVPKPEFKEVDDPEVPWKDEAAPEPRKGPQEPTKAEPTNVPTVPEAPAPAPAAATLADVQQACARLRDAGKMAEVKGLFPEFGIKKLSDLKGPEQLAAFAARLKKLEG